MDDLIPIEDLIEENPRVNELEKQGYIIKPERINEYLSDLKDQFSTLPKKSYWEKKRVLQYYLKLLELPYIVQLLLDHYLFYRPYSHYQK